MAVNDDMAALLELVVCPSCQSKLTADAAGLRCTGLGHAFDLHDRVPVLETETGAERRPSALARLRYAVLGNPRLYDFHQKHGGGRPIAAQVGDALDGVGDATLLDVGAGTGMVASLVPAETRYVWLDNDMLKLRGFIAKSIDGFAVLGDAARLPFGDRTADWTVMVEVSHHLPNGALRACLDEVARVTRDRFVFVDALRGNRLRSKLLWQFDLGRYPRSERELVDALEVSFDVQEVERFRVNHDHILCVCRPRPRTAP
jgi:SAM-dependent methyltransferase